ncbi:MAG TPA: NmrA family NAD(P)-binding protein [Jatrophihabitantaceae bacterium]|nr:NmrA family NAD(P)-binding protein [Jatrophihabitantaceae bacterium]
MPESLRAAFTGVDGVFAMTTPLLRPGYELRIDLEVTHGHAIADAAAAASVPHVVYSSVGGAERHTGIPHFDSKRDIEEYLVAQGLSTTFVRPVFFMDNFALFAPPTMEDGKLVVRLPLPPGIPLQMITADDIGAVAAAAVLDPDRVTGGSIEIAGDELTGEQIAEAYQHRYDVPARYEPLPIEVLGGDVDQRAMFEWYAHLPAFQADFAATRALAPGTKTFEQWLATRPICEAWFKRRPREWSRSHQIRATRAGRDRLERRLRAQRWQHPQRHARFTPGRHRQHVHDWYRARALADRARRGPGRRLSTRSWKTTAPADGERPVDVAGVFPERQSDLAGRS